MPGPVDSDGSDEEAAAVQRKTREPGNWFEVYKFRAGYSPADVETQLAKVPSDGFRLTPGGEYPYRKRALHNVYIVRFSSV